MHTLHHPEPMQYGKTTQTINIDNSKPLSKNDITLLQSKLRTTYYHARMMDITTLAANNDTSIDQPTATTTTNEHVANLLNYLSANPNVSQIQSIRCDA